MELKGLEHMSFTQRLRLARHLRDEATVSKLMCDEFFKKIGTVTDEDKTNNDNEQLRHW